MSIQFADDTVLLAESEGDLQRVINEFYSVCKRRKLKVNAGLKGMDVTVEGEGKGGSLYALVRDGTKVRLAVCGCVWLAKDKA